MSEYYDRLRADAVSVLASVLDADGRLLGREIAESAMVALEARDIRLRLLGETGAVPTAARLAGEAGATASGVTDPLVVEQVHADGDAAVWVARCRLCPATGGKRVLRYGDDRDEVRGWMGPHTREVHGVPPWPRPAEREPGTVTLAAELVDVLARGTGTNPKVNPAGFTDALRALVTEPRWEIPSSAATPLAIQWHADGDSNRYTVIVHSPLVERLASAIGVLPWDGTDDWAAAIQRTATEATARRTEATTLPADLRRSRTEEVRRDAVARDRDWHGVDGAALDADAQYGERITTDRSFPVPVLVELCGLCGEPWSEHEQQALRRSTGPDASPVELIDCVRVQAVAAQGPPGPVGAKGDRGERGARGPAGRGGGWADGGPIGS